MCTLPYFPYLSHERASLLYSAPSVYGAQLKEVYTTETETGFKGQKR